MSRLPLLVVALAHDVDWQAEAACFTSLCQARPAAELCVCQIRPVCSHPGSQADQLQPSQWCTNASGAQRQLDLQADAPGGHVACASYWLPASLSAHVPARHQPWAAAGHQPLLQRPGPTLPRWGLGVWPQEEAAPATAGCRSALVHAHSRNGMCHPTGVATVTALNDARRASSGLSSRGGHRDGRCASAAV